MTIRFVVDNHVARVTIDRPDRMNAIDEASEAELIRIWETIEADNSVRCVVVTGAGERAFCTGADMKQSGNKTGLEYRAAARKALIRTNHVSGSFDVDDLQNWTSMAESNAGVVARDDVFNYAGGAGLEPVGYRGWPGRVYGVDHSEVNQRHMYETWAELMDWDPELGIPRNAEGE